MTTPVENLQELGQLIRQKQADDAESRAESAHRRAQFMKATVPRHAARQGTRRSLSAAAAVVLTLLVWRWWPEEPLRYSHAEGTFGRVGTVLETPASGHEALSFTDGTTVLLRESTKASVVETSARGAHIRLSRGQTAVSVVPHEDARWSFRAGPYTVEVKGTRFDLGWDPDLGHFSLEMSDGKVLVTGPNLKSPKTLIAGQRLDLRVQGTSDGLPGKDLNGKGDELAELRAEEPTLEEKPAAIVVKKKRSLAEPRSAMNLGPNAPEQGSTPPPADNWQSLADDGQFVDAVRRIKGGELDELLQNSEAKELTRLGDVARYAGDGLLATRAYEALRRRFPGTRAAAEAAFYLGRLVAPHQSAVRWFRTYLQAQPQGRLSQEAWGRIIEIHHRRGASKAADAAARHYLETYPSGPHATLARRLVGP